MKVTRNESKENKMLALEQRVRRLEDMISKKRTNESSSLYEITLKVTKVTPQYKCTICMKLDKKDFNLISKAYNENWDIETQTDGGQEVICQIDNITKVNRLLPSTVTYGNDTFTFRTNGRYTYEFLINNEWVSEEEADEFYGFDPKDKYTDSVYDIAKMCIDDYLFDSLEYDDNRSEEEESSYNYWGGYTR